ncbi:MAG: hypothetical protein KJ880_06445 [Candidatus Omnitrophica bacterium]|nr:hypothetical protein [Candidatus Omnitrophota bacterium]MBU1869515.1 hypothetical protein [Candidatus Omnitrophota bacterium]
MEGKLKFVIIGVAGVALVFLVLFISALGGKQALQKQVDELSEEKKTLSASLDQANKDIRRAKDQQSSLSREIDRLRQDKVDLDRRYELVNRAKDELVERIKTLQKQQREQPPKQAVAPAATSYVVGSDSDPYWAGILKAKTDLEMQLEAARKELKSIQINNEELQRDKSSLELDLNNIKRDNDDLKRQIAYNQKLMDSIAQELVREKNDKSKIQDNLKILKVQNDMLSREVKALNSRKVNLERRAKDIQDEKNTLENRMSEMETMLSGKISDIGNLQQELEGIRNGSVQPKAESAQGTAKKDSVELPAIVVRPPSGDQDDSLASGGRVLAVNRDNNFVIINLGKDSGIKIGDAFQVVRGSDKIALVEAIKVSKTVAACDIKKELSPIKIGDNLK